SQKALSPFCDPHKFVDIESDGSLGVFCNRWSLSGFGLLDAEGEIVWLKDDETPFEVSNFKDLDGDGSLDFCARLKQSLACFNLASGDELWRETGTQFVQTHTFPGIDLSIVEDGTAYVVAQICSVPSNASVCDSGRQWEIRDARGTFIERIALDCDETIDELCHLTRERFQDRAVQLVHGPPLRFLDSDNRLLTEPQTPPSAWNWRVREVAVLPSLEGRAQIGVIWNIGPPVQLSWDRSLFTIHNGNGDVDYEEVLGTTSFELWNLEKGRSAGESKSFLLSARDLLLGGKTELYLYQPTALASGIMVNKESLSGSSR
ncbi:MAG: hypothetical protein IH987_10175, partial [Planctomycetes bacterium]|nr:hypothetical protein [Planctomycetota bacterium]